MSSQRYERVRLGRRLITTPPSLTTHFQITRSGDDEEDSDHETHSRDHSPHHQLSHPIPSSPPPSFRSHLSSPRRRSVTDTDPLVSEADRTLADTFDAPSDSESDDEGHHRLDDRQRVMSGRPSAAASEDAANTGDRPQIERMVTQLPSFPPATAPTRHGRNVVHDGVFANLSAKPERGDDAEEKPPVCSTLLLTSSRPER